MGFAHVVTSVFCSSRATLNRYLHSRPSRRRARGFTLVELVAVVVIIAVVSALAIPTITSRLRDRRTQQAAQTVAQLYSTARMRAMGRGAAVMVRYDGTAFQMREAVRGGDDDPNCDPLPVSSCQIGNPWSLAPGAPNRLITTFDPSVRSEFEGVEIAMADATDGSPAAAMEVCFTPMGSAFVGYTLGGPLVPLAGVPVASVRRVDASGVVGLTRIVRIMPNGNSHLGTAQP